MKQTLSEKKNSEDDSNICRTKKEQVQLEIMERVYKYSLKKFAAALKVEEEDTQPQNIVELREQLNNCDTFFTKKRYIFKLSLNEFQAIEFKEVFLGHITIVNNRIRLLNESRVISIKDNKDSIELTTILKRSRHRKVWTLEEWQNLEVGFRILNLENYPISTRRELVEGLTPYVPGRSFNSTYAVICRSWMREAREKLQSLFERYPKKSLTEVLEIEEATDSESAQCIRKYLAQLKKSSAYNHLKVAKELNILALVESDATDIESVKQHTEVVENGIACTVAVAKYFQKKDNYVYVGIGRTSTMASTGDKNSTTYEIEVDGKTIMMTSLGKVKISIQTLWQRILQHLFQHFYLFSYLYDFLLVSFVFFFPFFSL